MPNYDYHFFREISEQSALWNSISTRASEFQLALGRFQHIEPSLIQVTGRGSSAHAARVVASFAERMFGVPSRFFPIEDGAFEENQSSHAKLLRYPTNISFLFSQSGQSPDLLKAAAQLQAISDLSVGITNSSNSPLVSLVDVHLELGATQELAVAATKTFSGSVLVGLLAAAELVGKQEVFLSQLRSAISDVKHWVDVAMNIPEKLIDDLVETKRAILITPAKNIPFAQEAALKLSENAGITAIALSPSDALHGPVAQISDEVTILVLGSTDDAYQCGLFLERAEGMTRRGWKISTNGFERSQPKPFAIARANFDQILVGLLELVPMQWLSGEVALRLGLDPDSPRALSKQTLTH